MSATLRTGENSEVSIGKVESQEWFRTNLVQQLNLTIRGKNSILQNLWASQSEWRLGLSRTVVTER